MFRSKITVFFRDSFTNVLIISDKSHGSGFGGESSHNRVLANPGLLAKVYSSSPGPARFWLFQKVKSAERETISSLLLAHLIASVLLMFCDMRNRDLKQTTTTKATRTSPNKRFNEQNNSGAQVSWIVVHFLPSSANQERKMT